MIVIVDYGAGNTASIQNMLRRAGGDAVISGKREDIEVCDKIILPGVGAFDYGAISLAQRDLITPILSRAATGVPILGICLGMQLLGKGSEEGVLPGLGLIPAYFRRFSVERHPGLRVPHVGWNTVTVLKKNPLIEDEGDEQRFYFVHSYYAECGDQRCVIATTTYGEEFPSAYGLGNTIGCQFHPEKSHRFGLTLMRKYLEL